jgi:hypothetical protein
MLESLFNGTNYKIVAIGAQHPGWHGLGAADTIAEAYAICKKDWDFYWGLCGFLPSRQISVILA